MQYTLVAPISRASNKGSTLERISLQKKLLDLNLNHNFIMNNSIKVIKKTWKMVLCWVEIEHCIIVHFSSYHFQSRALGHQKNCNDNLTRKVT